MRREQEFYLLGLVHCDVHDIDELFARWSAVYPEHLNGGRVQFECVARALVGNGKVSAKLEGDRLVKLFPPIA